MEQLLILVLCISFALLLFFRSFNKSLTYYIIFGFFLIMPVLSPYINYINIIITLNPSRIFLIPVLLVLPYLLFNRGVNNQRNQLTYLFSLMLVYNLFNTFYATGEINLAETGHYLFLLVFTFTVESLNFSDSDSKILLVATKFLILIIFAVTIVQAFINPFFMISTQRLIQDPDSVLIQAFGYNYRNISIFSNFYYLEGFYFMGLLSIFIIFHREAKQLYLKRSQLVYFVLISIAIYFSYTRTAWLFTIMSFCGFIYFSTKEGKSRFNILIIFAIITLVISTDIISSLTNSEVFEKRVSSESYLSRTETLRIFFTHLWDKNILFGYGETNSADAFIAYGRRGGALNGFIQEYVKGGLLGLTLLVLSFWVLWKKGKIVYKRMKNPVIILMILGLIVANFTSSFNQLSSLPYFFLIFTTELYYKVALKLHATVHED